MLFHVAVFHVVVTSPLFHHSCLLSLVSFSLLWYVALSSMITEFGSTFGSNCPHLQPTLQLHLHAPLSTSVLSHSVHSSLPFHHYPPKCSPLYVCSNVPPPSSTKLKIVSKLTEEAFMSTLKSPLLSASSSLRILRWPLGAP